MDQNRPNFLEAILLGVLDLIRAEKYLLAIGIKLSKPWEPGEKYELQY